VVLYYIVTNSKV